jgi:hypothetical protein
MAETIPLDLEDAELAYQRVRSEIDGVSADNLTAMNVDVVSAASLALAAADRVTKYTERMRNLPEFDMRSVERLSDYAKATWFVYADNLPYPEPKQAQAMQLEVGELRAKFLMWAGPIAGSGIFDQAAVDRIREGSGNKDSVTDLMSLVRMYRTRWDQVNGICAITQEELTRAADISTAVFGFVSRRENQVGASVTDGGLQMRRVWTLLDRAYGQCRRGLAFLCYEKEDIDAIAPNLRRNAGRGGTSSATQVPSPTTPVAPPVAGDASPSGASGIGGTGGPFIAKP